MAWRRGTRPTWRWLRCAHAPSTTHPAAWARLRRPAPAPTGSDERLAREDGVSRGHEDAQHAPRHRGGDVLRLPSGPLAGVPIVLKDASITQAGEPWHEGLRPARDARYLAPAVREVLHDLDSQKPAQGIHALEDLLGATYARDRQAMFPNRLPKGSASGTTWIPSAGLLKVDGRRG